MSKHVIIDAEAIQKRMKELEKSLQNEPNPFLNVQYNSELDTLRRLLHLSTPLIPEISKAYDAGKLDKQLSEIFDNPKGRFISNLKFDI